MRILVAPDKFKGSLTATQAATAITEGVLRVYPQAEVVNFPIADGGEGTLEAVYLAGFEKQQTTVTSPLGAVVEAEWALGDVGSRITAVIESTTASGLGLMQPSTPNALDAHSFGTGELISAALDAGVSEIIIGLGGSAMTDGGMGAIRALGLKVRDAFGHDIALGGGALSEAATVDSSEMDPRLQDVAIRLAVDVQNGLHGPGGAAHVYGPQKGADQDAVDLLDTGLQRWSTLLDQASGRQSNLPGAGAAGGFPAPFLAFTHATIESGYALVASLTGLTEQLASFDLVITGEGSMDAQSLQGKAPIALARAAAERGIAVIALAGRIMIDKQELALQGVSATAQILDLAQWTSGVPDAEDAMANAALYLRSAAAQTLAAGSAPLVKPRPGALLSETTKLPASTGAGGRVAS
ncbi:glycerate kinase [Paenarthrobacter nitroguajacolicus]|uniref:glycerate kinase n=1 Tax=Paenarthrobacter nitroguajacolicus TaxID=211146 RepID=UPI000A9BC13E|nr:glycerate kinase [Paenarthrobacter nitroguajacolicus]